MALGAAEALLEQGPPGFHRGRFGFHTTAFLFRNFSHGRNIPSKKGVWI
jgi:hypothetical protein